MEAQAIKLLVVDDEPAIRRVLRTCLGTRGFTVREEPTGEAALGTLQRRPSDVALLDINMPGMSGVETCRRMRRALPQIGIVMISVRAGEDDKVRALEAGADDYITKPFRFGELLARLHAVYRRMHSVEQPTPTVLRSGDIELDLEARILRKTGVEVRISRKEFDILAFLMERPNAPVPHAKLLQAVWGPEYGGELEYLRTYVRRLRKMVERDPARPEYIITESWIGYRFRNLTKPSSVQ